jgi:predicted PurR-regulated permease PerM
MQKSLLTRSTLILSVLSLTFAILYFVKPLLLVPLSVAALLAMLFMPFCIWMEKRGVARAFAAFICVLSFLSISCSCFTDLAAFYYYRRAHPVKAKC